MTKFQIGDIVKLVNSEVYEKSGYSRYDLYTIKEIIENGYCLNGVKASVNSNDIRPLKIDGIDDYEVYLEYPHKASIIKEDTKFDGELRYRYYMDMLKEKYPNTYTTICKCKFQYVHEVQHYLRDNKDLRMYLNIFSVYNE